MEFTNAEVNIEVLKQRAYNMRWAEVPEGVIPLTAADSDFPAAPEISQALNDYISGGYFSYTPKLGYPSLREAVAKALKTFRDAGAVRTGRGRFEILRLDVLDRFASGGT